jgi:hypothetical protein
MVSLMVGQMGKETVKMMDESWVRWMELWMVD